VEDEDFDLIEDSKKLFLDEPMKAPRYLLRTIVIFVTLFILWAYFAKLDERTSATGIVIPSTQVQELQNLEGGIVSVILVEEGEVVEKDQILIRLDDTRFLATYQEELVNSHALEAKLIRLTAEANGQDTLEFPQSLVENSPEFVANERQLFQVNRASHLATLDTLNKSLKIAEETFNIAKPLSEEGVISKLEFLKYQKEINEIQGKISVEEQTYLSKVNEQLVQTKSELDSLKETLEGLKDRIDRTIIKSPLKGIVKKIYVDTIGGVIKAGEKIVEIVPVDDVLLVEAKVPPEKIAFIVPDQEASIKFSAYDSAIYGSLKGRVKYISADAIVEKNERGVEESFYKIIIETDQNYLDYNGEELPIIPGMQVSADILTGEKTVLQYIFTPIIRTKQKALKER